MNGAQRMMASLVAHKVDVCFANPGTTETHLVAALDENPSIRAILGLFEGVCTGAADGYARMTGKPAMTLLHLGAGLGYGLPNLHNARRAHSPVINVVGDHATYHLANDPPLASDIASVAATVGAVYSCTTPDDLATQVAAATVEARTAPGKIATLIVPADCAWGESKVAPPVRLVPPPRLVKAETITAVAKALRAKEPAIILLGSALLTERGLALAGRIAQATGARLLANRVNARAQRGAGRLAIEKLPYSPILACQMLEPAMHVVLVGTPPPVAFYAWPDKPTRLIPPHCRTHVLSTEEEDGMGALEALAEALNARKHPDVVCPLQRPPLPTGSLTVEKVWQALTALMPEEAIVSDEGITANRQADLWTAGAPPHDWLNLAGGAIGQGMAVATGAAVACPGRKVFSMQSDGGSMFTPQSLWTQAHEKLDVVTVIFANRSYQILRNEFTSMMGREPGRVAASLTGLNSPFLDWVQLAGGMGVEASRAATAEAFSIQLQAAIHHSGPHVIEALV